MIVVYTFLLSNEGMYVTYDEQIEKKRNNKNNTKKEQPTAMI